jgi:enamine deaminase RidA (YjgF/YER057c/UK114 family)
MTTPHRNVNPEQLLPPVGFSHATVAAPGHTIHLGGQTGHRADGSLDDGLIDQFAQALDNLVTVLEACEARAEHVVSITIYTTDVAPFRTQTRELGQVWRDRLGRHYPAMALLGVAELHDPDAKVEVLATAVLPDAGG